MISYIHIPPTVLPKPNKPWLFPSGCPSPKNEESWHLRHDQTSPGELCVKI